MKHVLIILFLFSILLTACTTKTITPGVVEACEKTGGTWLSDYNECEYVSQDDCQAMAGSFEECTSACRHDPNAQACTLECVPVCTFT